MLKVTRQWLVFATALAAYGSGWAQTARLHVYLTSFTSRPKPSPLSIFVRALLSLHKRSKEVDEYKFRSIRSGV